MMGPVLLPALREMLMRVRNLLAVASALALVVALVFVTVTLQSGPSKPARPAVPVQQAQTAAGLTHRVSAAADLGRVAGGRVVAAAAKPLPGSVVADITSGHEVPGAVRRADKPKPLKLPVQGHTAPQTAKVLAPPAMKKAAGYDQKTSRKLAPATADQVVYANADGTKTAFQYTAPVNYRLPDGTWKAIGTSLTATAATGSSAGWTENSQAYPESFAASAAARNLVTVPLDGSHTVSFGIAGAPAVTGAASGSTVTYADVRPGATVRFSAGTGLVKEAIVLSSPPTSPTWVFPLDLKGLRARMGPGGIVEFADTAGKVLGYVPPGYMTDSNVNPHSGDGATSYGVTYSLTTAGGRQAITMKLDAAWLDSKSRVYPVTVDPSVDPVNTNGSTYVQYPQDSDFSGDTELHVGTWDGGSDIARSYLAFGNVASALKNDTVLGVQLGLYNNWSYSCSPRPVYVYPVTSSWSVTGAKSWPGPSTGAAIGRKSFATGWEPNGLGSPCPASWEGIVLDQGGVSLVNGWTHGTVADNGLAVGASGSDSYGWKKFTSQQSAVAPPFLGVTYTTDGASYRLAARRPVTPVTPSAAGKLAISVTNTGSSTWTTTNGFEMSYRAYNAKGAQVANHPVFTPMPSTVAPGAAVTVNVTVNALPVGNYVLDFDMYSGATGSSPAAFSASFIPPFPVSLFVPEPAPVINNVYPPTGYVSPTLQQQLSTSATETGTLTYVFTLTCAPLTGQTCAAPSVTSGTISKAYWTPPAGDLDWNTPYTWSVKVTGTSGSSSNSTTISGISLVAQVPQPLITANLGGSGQQAYNPLNGNYTTSATDAPVASVGPKLEIDRTYNSMDPRTSGAFGAGWSSAVDASLRDDGATVEITLPGGQQIRFGKNGDGLYAAPSGSQDVLVKNTPGTWTLRDDSGDQDTFTSTGLLASITDPSGHAQNFTYNPANQATTITDAASGRTLSLIWSTPSGTLQPHVASVTTQPPAAGQSGLTWTYSYSGDDLTQVCAPATTGTGCTAYTYTAASHYQPSVLDAGSRDYWQLGEASGAAAADEVDVNLGTTDGTYHNVTLGAAGPLAGSSETAASFNGTSSYVSLPNNVVSDSTDVSVGLWFKAASGSKGGVLFSYDADPVTNSSGSSANRQPLLYIGVNGDLYGEFWNGAVAPLHTTTSVEDGKWHYAVITASSSSQSLYLDGAQIGLPLSGTINQLNSIVDTIGAGFWNSWPENTSTALSYFDGDIGQVAVYPVPLSGTAIATQYAVATAASPAMTQVTLPSGNIQESASYDSATGRIATYTDRSGGQWTISPPLATGYRPTADSLGQVLDNVTVSGPGGRHATYQYDMLDSARVVSVGNGVDPPADYGYDAAGFLASTVDADGNLTCLTNDIHGNVLTRTWYPVEPATLPGGGVGANSSPCGGSAASSPSCPTSGAPCTTFFSYYYNTSNPLDPRNDKLLTMQDGRSASVTDTTYLTSYGYNSAGQMISQTSPGTPDFPGGRTTRHTYSTGTETAANGGTIPAGLMLTQTTPGGAQTSYSYDSNGDLAQVTEPSTRYAQYTYDTLGRRLTSTVFTSTFKSGETTSYAYTPTGKQATVTYPTVANAVTSVTHQLEDSHAYDADDNLLTTTESDLTGGDPSRTTTYSYNDHDQVATVTQPAGATTGGTAQSDGAASANPGGATTAYDYDAFGNVTQRTDPNGNQIRSSYNEYNEPTQEILYTSDTNASSSVATCTAPATADADGGCDLVLRSKAYDPAGLLASETDAMGRTTNYTYDHDQKLIQAQTTQACSTTAPCTSLAPCTPTAQCTTGTVGTMTTYTYDGAGNLVSRALSATHTGAAGTTTTTNYTYDAADRLTTEVQDAPPASGGTGYQSRTTSYTYNADDKVLSQTVGTGTGTAVLVADFGYDTTGNMTSQTVTGSGTNLQTTWTYDQNGKPLTMTTPRGNASGATAADYTTNYAYDPAGDMITATGPPVAVSSYTSQDPTTTRPVTTYGYDTFGDQTQAEDPDGNLTATAYDGDGRKTSVTQAPYTAPGALSATTATTTYTYDEAGNLASRTDPAANVVNYTYDALSDMTSQTVPQPSSSTSAPGTWTFSYDSDGEQLSAKDPLGNTTAQTYDYFGNVASSTDGLGNTTRYGYNYLGDQTMQDTPDGSVSTSTYDRLGELASTADGAGNTTSYTYNGQGNVSQVTNPDGTSAQYGYDQAGQLTSVADWSPVPAGGSATKLRSESFGYDADGNQTSATDWNGTTTTDAYNALGELTSATQPVSASASITTSYGYDAAGNQTSVIDGNGNTTWTTYNTWNLPESVVEPTTPAATSAAETTWTTAYDADGQPATVTEPGGVSLSYGYDSAGDVTSESGSGASAPTDARSFGYDTDQQLTSATAPGGTDSYTYNGAGELTGASGPSGASSYSYNGDGLVASQTAAAGTTSYTYDTADRLSKESEPLTGSTLSYAYNSDGNPTSISYATSGTAGPVQAFGYNSLQQVTSDTLTSASGTTLASQTYGYDANGNITSQATGGGLANTSATYSYDEANRLISSASGGTTTSYAYDSNGNMTQDGSVTSSYNAQNQLTSATSPAGTTSYGYTLNGGLSSVTPPTGSAQSYTSDAYGDLASAGGVSYTYDALGRMVSRGTGSGSTSLAYLGTSDSLASDGTSDYTYTPSGTVTAAGTPGGTAYATMTDQHGDLVAAFSPTSAAASLAGSSSYSPYGGQTSSGHAQNLGYQGDYTDPSTGLVYMNARWYNPATGTFVSSDTIGGSPVPSAVDGNPYAYANGNPLTETDQTGHMPTGCVWCGVTGWGLCGPACAIGGYFLGPSPSTSPPVYYQNQPYYTPAYPWSPPSVSPTSAVPFGGGQINEAVYSYGGGCGWQCYVPPAPPPPPPAAPAPAKPAPPWLKKKPILPPQTPDIKNPKDVPPPDLLPNPAPPAPKKQPVGTEPNPGQKSPNQDFPEPLPVPATQDSNNCFNKGTPQDPVYGPLQSFPGVEGGGRATFAEACLTGFRRGSKATANFPGWDGQTMDRTHLLARQFGGAGGRKNVVPFGWWANQVTMRYYEMQIGAMLATNQRVFYEIIPMYGPISSGASINNFMPFAIELIWGTRQSGLHKEFIENSLATQPRRDTRRNTSPFTVIAD